MSNTHLFPSGSVTEGHPNKMADQVSGAVLDAALKDDPKSRAAGETCCVGGKNEQTIMALVDLRCDLVDQHLGPSFSYAQASEETVDWYLRGATGKLP